MSPRLDRYPPSATSPTVDTYHGVPVADPYRWLENAADPAVAAWTAAQNRHTRAHLDSIPARERLLRRLTELYTASASDYLGLVERGGRLFAIKSQPPKQQPFLVTLASADDPAAERVVLDPNVLDPSGTTTIDFFVPSLDGRLVAVSLSEKGTEEGTLHVYEVASGHELGDVIPRVTFPTAGGSVAWDGDGTGFYYTRYPRGDERPPEDRAFYQQVYFHRLGTPTEADRYCIGADFPRIAEIDLQTSPDGRYVLATVANGDGGEYAHYLREPAGVWRQVTTFSDEATHAEFGRDGALCLLSRREAPRGKLLRLPLADPLLERARTVVPEGDGVIDDFIPTATKLYVVELVGGPSILKLYDLPRRGVAASDEATTLPTPPITSIGRVARLEGDAVLFRVASFVQPPAWYSYAPGMARPERTALYVTAPASFEDVEVVREFATSSDGTRIPLNIMRPKGLKLDGTTPTILSGYGGYGISLSPSFAIRRRVWFDHGGVFVVANLRGGGEYGEGWHQAGMLTTKQNVFDDLAACARYLVDAGYTNPSKLAIEGGSNGGLLMGAALTQHPELFAAVVAHVGLYDMIRVELDPNGAFNVTEFGTVADPEQFRALYAYSPYHHVVDGTPYPAVLLATGENDGRVNPANSRKMAARLQAATTSGRPVLLRTSGTAGHGAGTALSERIAQDADVFAFLFEQLGVV